MEKKDRNAKPGDSEIVTKKGFLITPPKRNKDKNAPAESNIKPAVTVNQKPAEEKKQNEHKPHDKNHHKPKRFDKKNHDKDRKPEENRPQKENTPKGKEQPKKIKPNHPEKQEQQKDNQPKKNDRPHNKNDRTRQHNKPAPDHKPAPENKENKNKETNNNQQKQSKKNNGTTKINQSVLSDLGFINNSFSKNRTAVEPDNNDTEIKIDYSKAIPLRDQIYPPKKQKAPLTDEEKQNKTEIIGIRFKEAGKIYYFDPNGETVSFGTPVIVETARGLEYGFTAIGNRFIPTDSIISPLKKILRIATREDTERLEANKRLEKQAEGIFTEKVAKLGLEMSLVGVEYTFDNTKILFYFAAENRIDFRELVKELASVFRTRIELRQVGVRDEAKMLGGLGVCGRPLCCHTFLGEFAQVSIKMAKDQSLSLNSAKISGTCGRLLCCLRYEDEVYQQEYERTPKVDAIVETEDGKGIVVETNPLKGIVRVRLDSNKEAPPKAFHRDTVKILGYIKKNDAAMDAELKALEKE